MKKKFKKAIAVILTIAMAMSVGVPAFANTEVDVYQQRNTDIQTEIVVDLAKIKEGSNEKTVLYQTQLYLLADGTVTSSYNEAQSAKERGIFPIGRVMQSVGYECWYDDEIVMFLEFEADDPVISYVESYFYAQKISDLVPETMAEAVWWTEDYDKGSGLYTVPTDYSYITVRLAIPNLDIMRIGYVDTYVITTEKTMNFKPVDLEVYR
jgi:hypothetical protein